MKIETIEEFVVFARHLNFSKAAEEMFMSQPSLSQHISSLEEEIGFKLVERGHRSSLTPAGQVFVERCQELLELYHAALSEGRIAASATPPARILDNRKNFELHLLASLVKGVPYALVNADESLTAWDAIEEDVADMGLALEYDHIEKFHNMAKERGLDSVPVGVARLGIVMMKSHPLAQKSTLSKEDLYEYPIGIGTGSIYEEWQEIITDLIKPSKPLRFRLDPLGGLANQASFNFKNALHFSFLDSLAYFMRGRDDVVIFEELDGKPLETLSVIVYNAKSKNPNVGEFIKRLREITSSPSYPALPHEQG